MNMSFEIETHIKRQQEEIDNAVLGEIKEIAKENGLERHILLNEKNIVSALGKQIPRKPVPTQQPCKSRFACSICDKRLYSKQKFCDRCGQALDWSDTE